MYFDFEVVIPSYKGWGVVLTGKVAKAPFIYHLAAPEHQGYCEYTTLDSDLYSGKCKSCKKPLPNEVVEYLIRAYHFTYNTNKGPYIE